MRNDDATVMRLRSYLAAVKARYPAAWDQLAELRQAKEELGGWPAWCYVPLAGAYTIVTGNPKAVRRAGDVGVVGALGAWRMTQGVYRFDADLLEALWTTPIESIPVELLYRLPEWCVYIELPGRIYGALSLHGAFIWLECDSNTHRSELRALLDIEEGQLVPIVLHLTGDRIDAAIEGALAEALRHLPENTSLPAETWQQVRKSYAEIWPSLISLTLYLCSDEPDILDEESRPARPTRPQPQKTKRGVIQIPASAPKAWVIGARLGAALREAQSREAASQGGTHASPRGHIRRAHWHTYLMGTGKGDRKLRWLPPIPVNIKSIDVHPITIHPVSARN